MAGHAPRACRLALCLGHEIVAVAMATSIPEMRTLGCQDIIVVAWRPDGAGAGGPRQRAGGALNCNKQRRNMFPSQNMTP